MSLPCCLQLYTAVQMNVNLITSGCQNDRDWNTIGPQSRSPCKPCPVVCGIDGFKERHLQHTSKMERSLWMRKNCLCAEPLRHRRRGRIPCILTPLGQGGCRTRRAHRRAGEIPRITARRHHPAQSADRGGMGIARRLPGVPRRSRTGRPSSPPRERRRQLYLASL